jgi:hypothetical protein
VSELKIEGSSQYFGNSESGSNCEHNCKKQAVMSYGRASGKNGKAGGPQQI